MEKYLFLCAMGINRSATAAFVASRIAETKGLDIEFFYGGIDAFLNELEICPSKELENKLKNYLDEHDKIFVMEDYMMKGILKLGIERRKLECLNILDKYVRNESVLVEMLEEKLKFKIEIKDAEQA